jgi:hypothetical protein
MAWQEDAYKVRHTTLKRFLDVLNQVILPKESGFIPRISFYNTQALEYLFDDINKLVMNLRSRSISARSAKDEVGKFLRKYFNRSDDSSSFRKYFGYSDNGNSLLSGEAMSSLIASFKEAHPLIKGSDNTARIEAWLENFLVRVDYRIKWFDWIFEHFLKVLLSLTPIIGVLICDHIIHTLNQSFSKYAVCVGQLESDRLRILNKTRVELKARYSTKQFCAQNNSVSSYNVGQCIGLMYMCLFSIVYISRQLYVKPHAIRGNELMACLIYCVFIFFVFRQLDAINPRLEIATSPWY